MATFFMQKNLKIHLKGDEPISKTQLWKLTGKQEIWREWDEK